MSEFRFRSIFWEQIDINTKTKHINKRNLGTFCECIDIDKIGVVMRHFSQICNRDMALD